MENYCPTTGCLRNFILSYFGEQHRKPCGHCGHCDSEYKTMDLTTPAKNVIRCVAEMQGRYGITAVTGTLLAPSKPRSKKSGRSSIPPMAR
ncbi:RecQ family zinc-binding domain-containing protein [Holdemania massiliensis]|uniref:RecQ family zinc-binding domain-containing protein n=1 Tax=Holdemania massiliensis TaxID=1468449 RepID=UPI002676CDE4|nr:RecQ family zinc-binding domain-containing protein [Holdemania massiliensis]